MEGCAARSSSRAEAAVADFLPEHESLVRATLLRLVHMTDSGGTARACSVSRRTCLPADAAQAAIGGADHRGAGGRPPRGQGPRRSNCPVHRGAEPRRPGQVLGPVGCLGACRAAVGGASPAPWRGGQGMGDERPLTVFPGPCRLAGRGDASRRRGLREANFARRRLPGCQPRRAQPGGTKALGVPRRRRGARAGRHRRRLPRPAAQRRPADGAAFLRPAAGGGRQPRAGRAPRSRASDRDGSLGRADVAATRSALAATLSSPTQLSRFRAVGRPATSAAIRGKKTLVADRDGAVSVCTVAEAACTLWAPADPQATTVSVQLDASGERGAVVRADGSVVAGPLSERPQTLANVRVIGRSLRGAASSELAVLRR